TAASLSAAFRRSAGSRRGTFAPNLHRRRDASLQAPDHAHWRREDRACLLPGAIARRPRGRGFGGVTPATAGHVNASAASGLPGTALNKEVEAHATRRLVWGRHPAGPR